MLDFEYTIAIRKTLACYLATKLLCVRTVVKTIEVTRHYFVSIIFIINRIPMFYSTRKLCGNRSCVTTALQDFHDLSFHCAFIIRRESFLCCVGNLFHLFIVSHFSGVILASMQRTILLRTFRGVHPLTFTARTG